VAVNIKTGDLIAVEAERVGTPEREGEVLEVISGGIGITYRVKWRDGRETLFSPAAGAIRVMPGATRGKTESKKRSTKAPKTSPKTSAKAKKK
jgi:hypothetical protein